MVSIEEEIEELSSPGVAAEITTKILLFFFVFGVSASVRTKSLLQQFGNKYALLTGLALQFIVMPLCGYVTVVALQNGDGGLTKAMGLSILVVTACPGGTLSNWWCSVLNAELSLSVAMTTVSTILAVVFLPLNLLLYSHFAYGAEQAIEAIDFAAIFISLGIVLGAILLGMLVSYIVDNATFRAWCNVGATISGLSQMLVSLVLTADDADTNLWTLLNHHWKFYVSVVIPSVLSLSAATLVTRCVRISNPEAVAITIECCYQSLTIATSIVIAMFPDPDDRAQAVAIIFLYCLVQNLILVVYGGFVWKAGWTKAPANEPFWVFITKTFEMDIQENNDGDGVFRSSNKNIAPAQGQLGQDEEKGNSKKTQENQSEEIELETTSTRVDITFDPDTEDSNTAQLT